MAWMNTVKKQLSYCAVIVGEILGRRNSLPHTFVPLRSQELALNLVAALLKSKSTDQNWKLDDTKWTVVSFITS